MTSIHPARRSAERFDAAIEGSSTGTPDAELRELLELVGALRQVAQPSPRTAFVSDLRAQLVLAAETDLVPATSVRAPALRAPRARRDRRIAVALGGLAIVGATTSMAVAAQSSLPGDALYPLKRAIEDVDTTITANDDHKGTELLDHASSRLSEVRELSRRSMDEDRARSIKSTLTAFSDQATEASDLLLGTYSENGSEESVTKLRTFTGESLTALARLGDALPESLRPAVASAAQVLVSIDQQAAETCPECDGLGITDIPTGLVPTGAALVPALGAPTKPPGGASGTTKDPEPGKARPSTAPTAAPPSPGPAGAATPPLPQPGSKTLPTKGPSGGTVGSTVDGIVKGVTGQPTTGASGTPTVPLPSLGPILDGALGSLTGLPSTLLDPLTGLPKKP